MLTHTVQCEGVGGLYRGLGVSLLSTIPSLSISYAGYGSAKSFLLSQKAAGSAGLWHRDKHGHAVLSWGGALLCGSLTGVVASVLTFPADVLRRRMQVQGMVTYVPGAHGHAAVTDAAGHHGVWAEVSALLKRDGPRGFYRGIFPELLKVCILSCLFYI